MDQNLVKIRREKIDRNSIQGFVLSESAELILLSYVYDFNLDGLMVLRKKDITSIETTNTERFQTKLLNEEGIYSKVDFNVDYDVTSWDGFISSALKKYRYFIVECESSTESDFAIGKVIELRKRSIVLEYFTGTGRWLEEYEEHFHKDITSCQVGNNYLNVYQRYFERNGT